MMKFNVEGMTCGHCQKAVKDALEGIPGVDSAKVDFAEGTALVEGSADVQVLISAVEDEGYTATLAHA
ncbi:cation transporter [soil metagenome]